MELDEFIELVKEQQGIDLSGVLTTADKIGRPERALEKQAIDDFMDRNPMAGGGMLVQPGDGSRLQYDGSKESQVINAYKILKNKLKRNPTRIEMVNAGFDPTTVDKWTKKNNLKLIKAQYTQEFQDKRIKGYKKAIENKKYDKLVVYDGKIKGPNSLIKAYLKDFKKRFKYPHDSKKYKKALEAGKVLSNSQLMEKYNLSLNSVEQINSVLAKSNKLKYPKQTYEGSLQIVKDQVNRRETAIKEKQGSVRFKKGTKEFPKGHAGNIYGNNLIRPGEIIYTPQKINVAMSGGVDPKDPKNRYSALDYKIKATEEKINKIKKSNMPLDKKKIELQKLDNKLVEYVGQSDGYKIATLSDGTKYGEIFRKSQSMDPLDIFPDKTEQEVIKFLKKYKNKKVKVNAAGEVITSPSEIENIKKAVLFEENAKLALENAKKVKIEETLASFANSSQCEIFIRKRKADGGRIPYQTGTVSLSECAKEGAKNFQEGKFKTADQAQDAAKLLGGGQKVLRGLMKYGIVPEAAYVAGEAVFRNILGEKPLNALKKSIDTFTFGLTDFTSGIEAEKFGKDADRKLAVDKFRASQNKVNSIEQEIANLETLNTGSQFGYEGDQTEAIQMKKAQLEAAKKELEQNYVNPDIVQYIDRKAENIADAQMAKSGFAKASAKDQMDGIPGVTDYMDTETARVFPKQPSQTELNLNMFPSFQDYQKSDQGQIDRTILNAPDKVLQEISPDALDLKKALQEEYKMENLKNTFGAEQIYGTQGVFSQPLAGGGIAKLAGVDQGPPPESGPNPQGLQGLLNRVKKI